MPLIWACLFGSLAGSAWAADQPDKIRQMAQLAEYIGADYPSAVADGRIIDAGEYQEMTEFAQVLVNKAALLTAPAGDVVADNTEVDKVSALLDYAQSLQAAIAGQQSVERVQQVAAELRQLLLVLSPDSSVPASLSPATEIRAYYLA
ncbi:MAG: hypothetical protein DRQ54_06265, partial [Gammaproteobacteria bacterium]